MVITRYSSQTEVLTSFIETNFSILFCPCGAHRRSCCLMVDMPAMTGPHQSNEIGLVKAFLVPFLNWNCIFHRMVRAEDTRYFRSNLVPIVLGIFPRWRARSAVV